MNDDCMGNFPADSGGSLRDSRVARATRKNQKNLSESHLTFIQKWLKLNTFLFFEEFESGSNHSKKSSKRFKKVA